MTALSRALALCLALVAAPLFGDVDAELRVAEQLAWAKKFAEAEQAYLRIRDPRARLGLARVVLWQGRYAEAATRFDELLLENPRDVDALEGRAHTAYWSGDLRRAARLYRRALAVDPKRQDSRRSLAEIEAASAPSQRFDVARLDDDQPLDVVRGEASTTFFSDPMTRWTIAGNSARFDGHRRGVHDFQSLRLENETRLGRMAFGGMVGVFDGRAIGGVNVRYRELTLRVDHREELSAAPALTQHASSTTATARWSRERRNLLAAAELSHRRWFDDNSGNAFAGWALVPWRCEGWTLWGGASVAVRDTRESRFRPTAVSSTLDQGFFRYSFRGEYDPYWTPDDLREARLVVAAEREMRFGTIKIQADGGVARDRGRSFGPPAGSSPLPPSIETYAFDRRYRPYRAGISAAARVAAHFHFEIGFERAVTVDYRSNSLHAALVRRR